MAPISLMDLSSAELRVTGRIVDASNASLLGEILFHEEWLPVIYKPVLGEKPLWDFPDGTLANREVAAFKVSEFLNLHLVPPTVLRDGPYGEGAVQLWCEQDPALDIVEFAQSDDPRLRLMVLFDAIINNTDRKFGHILLNGEQLLGCDHGVTFHSEDKLRTVLWQFTGEPLREQDVAFLHQAAELPMELLEGLITPAEFEAMSNRLHRLLQQGVYPEPSTEWPAVPWPPF